MARKKTPSETQNEIELHVTRAPLIFLSHDSRDGALAETFENLLTDASGGVLKTFLSSDRKGTSGIEFGAEWYTTIMHKLGEATDVVALLTRNSLGRPWILYEVGVARGRLATPAFGVAFGVSLAQITGPFSQFQNSGDDEDSLTKLVLQLIRRNPEATPREEAVRRQVAAFRERIPASPPESAAGRERATHEGETPAVAKLFEEVKVMFRELPASILQRMANAGLIEESGWSVHHVYMDLIGLVERALRDDVTRLIRESYPDLAAAAEAGVIPPQAVKREMAMLTMGQLRDVLRRLYEANHPAAGRLLTKSELEHLQPLMAMRNRLAHGEPATPEDVMQALVLLVRFISSNGSLSFTRELAEG
jgi:hypothetical protein